MEGLTAYTYSYMGSIYYYKKQLDSAASNFYKGVAILQNTPKVSNYLYTYAVYYAIGTFLVNINQLDLAKPYLIQAGEVALQQKDTSLLIEIECAKATLYAKKHQLDSAIQIYKTILSERKAMDHTKLNAYRVLGQIYSLSEFKNQPEKGVDYFEKGLHFINRNNMGERQQAVFLIGLANAYTGISLQKNEPSYYKRAKHIYEALDTMMSRSQLTTNELKYYYSNYALIH